MCLHLALKSILESLRPPPEIKHSKTIPPLLSLPRELRDDIIDYVLQSPLPTPQPPPFESRHPPKEPDSNIHRDGHKQTKVPQQPHDKPQQHTHSGTSLLLTCSQLREETLKRMQKVTSTPYVLDVMVVGTDSVNFTWLYVPPRVSDDNGLIDSLDIHLRFFRTKDGYNKNEREEWDSFMNRLWDIIATFLHSGARSLDHSDVTYYCHSACGKYGLRKLSLILYHENRYDWGPYENPFWPGQAYAEVIQKLSSDYPNCKIDKVEVHGNGTMRSFDYLEDMELYWGSLSNYNKVYLSRKRLGMRSLPID